MILEVETEEDDPIASIKWTQLEPECSILNADDCMLSFTSDELAFQDDKTLIPVRYD